MCSSDLLIDPTFYSDMSKLLDAVIKERKANAIDYQEYLNRIAEIAKNVNKGKSDDVPEVLITVAQRALYNNLGKDETLAMRIDAAVHESKRDGFRGHIAKENEIKASIYKQLKDYQSETGWDIASDPNESYGIEKKVEHIFNIVKEQKEY